MIDTAIILAGGFGTRLQTVVSELPKPMAPIGDRPFLAYLLNYLQGFGITKVILSVGYLHEKISTHFGNTYNEMLIEYSIETNPLGTGGGIKKALSTTEGDVFILNGDTFFNIDLRAMEAFHTDEKTALSIGLKPLENTDRYGTVILTNGKIIGFKEKTPLAKGLINGGIYITSKTVFENEHLPEIFSLEKDFIEPTLHKINIRGYTEDNYFIDIGIPEDYYRAVDELPKMIQR